MKRSLTADELRNLLHYEPTTGVFTWLRTDSRPPNWNALYVGKRAGYINKHLGRRLIAILVNGKKTRFYAALLAWLYMTGEWPQHEVDHRSTDSADDSWDNLRAATSSQNKCNRKGNRTSALGVKGIHFDKSRQKYLAQICLGKTRHHLGRYDTIEEAAAAYATAAAELHGEFARTA